MSKEVKILLSDVVLAMKGLDRYFDDKIEALRENGTEAKEIQGLVKGSQAMKDASGIYLTWASHYLEQIEKASELSEEEVITEV